MKFYERILRELREKEHSFETIYNYAFSFRDHVYFEKSSNLRIERTTYSQAQKHVEVLTAALSKKTEPGMIVALIMPNSPRWVELFWAVLRAGCRVLLLSHLMPDNIAARCLANTGAKIILGDVFIDGYETITPDSLYNEAADGVTGRIPAKWGDEVILATSSTTGEPKLLAYDGKAICAQLLNSETLLKTCREIARFDRGVLRMLAFLPFSHIFGLTACFLWFTIFGVTFVFLNDLKPETILRTCRLHRVTHVFAVPLLWDTMTARIKKTVEERNITSKFEKMMKISLKLQTAVPFLGRWFASVVFSSVHKQALGNKIKYCISGGGMLSKDTLPLINAIGYPLENGYGMTEIGVASLSTKKAGQRKGLGVGKPMDSLEFRLDENGQLLVRGKSCYTYRYVGGERIASVPGEYFETGDLFSVDETGEYLFIGRMDDLVNGANGERLSPDEIENQMALTIESCVFGGENGELSLMLRLPDQCRVSFAAWEREIERVREAIDKLPPHMRPRKIYLSDTSLPLSLSGKIRRQAIRKGVLDNTYPCEKLTGFKKPASGLDSDKNGLLVNALCGLFKEHSHTECEVTGGSHFFIDLGGDSLSFLELIGAIEAKFDLKISNAVSLEMTTPAACAKQIATMLNSVKQGEENA